jgi:hypothetical protein
VAFEGDETDESFPERRLLADDENGLDFHDRLEFLWLGCRPAASN